MTTLQQQARALGDPTRHAIFRYVADAAAPVGIAELTAHFSFNHNAIRQHLAKLAAAQLVVETKVQSGGPGRPRLVYVIDPAAENRWGAIGPYERLSLLLAEIIRTGETPVEVGRRAGRTAAGAAVAGEQRRHRHRHCHGQTGVRPRGPLSKDGRRDRPAPMPLRVGCSRRSRHRLLAAPRPR